MNGVIIKAGISELFELNVDNGCTLLQFTKKKKKKKKKIGNGQNLVLCIDVLQQSCGNKTEKSIRRDIFKNIMITCSYHDSIT